VHIRPELLIGAASAVFAWAGSAHAQTQVAVANVAAPVAGSEGLAAPTPSAERNDADEELPQHPMGWAGIGVKLGFDSVAAGSADIKSVTGRTGRRMGVHLGIPIQLGGEGASFTFEPYLSRSTMAHDLKDTAGVVTGSEDANLSAYGVYIGPTFNIHVARPAYVGFGFGIKGAYVHNPAFDYAYDLYARVPIHGTYYVSRLLAVVAEVGFGYGASVFVDKPTVVVDPVSRTARNVKDDPQFGLAFSCDATLGVRIP
jgi:hypothetical protein